MRRLIGLLCLTVLAVFSAKGQTAGLPSYIVAADLTYTCSGNRVYTFELTVYTECSSEFGELALVDNFPLLINSESLGKSLPSLTVRRSAGPGEVVKIFCEDATSTCDANDNTGFRGLLRYTYTGTKDFSNEDEATDWVIAWESKNRSFALNSTFDNAEIEQYYTDVLINTKDVTCNNSIQFNSGSKGPIVRVCTDETEIYELFATDSDGDDLQYTLSSPKHNANTDIEYAAGFSTTSPITVSTGLSVSDAGSIEINATTPDQIGMTDVVIEEHRGGVLVGRVRRGIQVNTFNCDNVKPEIGNINTTNSKEISFCVGETIEFGDIFIKGQDTIDGDKVKFINYSIIKIPEQTPVSLSGLRFVAFPQGDSTFFYMYNTPNSSDVGSYELILTLEDNGCPTSRQTIETFNITIVESPKFDIGESLVFKCDSTFEIYPGAIIGALPATYTWSNFEIDSTENPPLLNFPDTLSNDTSYLVDGPVRLGLLITDAVGCSNYDTVTFVDGLSVSAANANFCKGDTTDLYDLSSSLNGDIIRRDWYFLDGSGDENLGNEDSIKHAFPDVPGRYSIMLIVEDEVSCIDTLLGTVVICDNVTPAFGWKDSCTFNNGLGEIVEFFDSTNYADGCGPKFLNWIVKDSSGITKTNITYCEPDIDGTYPCPNPNSGQHFETFTEPGPYDVELIMTQVSTCLDTTLQKVLIHPTQFFELDAGNIFINCDSPDTLVSLTLNTHPDSVGTPTFTYGVTNLAAPNDTIPLSDEPNLAHLFNETGNYQFHLSDANGCDYHVPIAIDFPFAVGFVTDTVCDDETPLNFSLAIGGLETSGRTISSLIWDFDDDGVTSSEDNPSHLFSQQGVFNVSLTVSDTTGCVLTETISTPYTFPVDRFELIPDTQQASVCVNAQLTLQTAYWPTGTTPRIDTIFWDYGDGVTKTFIDSATVTAEMGSSVSHTYTDTVPVTITNYVIFNEGQCRIDNSFILPYKVQPEISGFIDPIHNCIGDSLEVSFVRTINNEFLLESAHWEVTPFPASSNSPIATSDELEPKFLLNPSQFFPGSDYVVDMMVQDANGCAFETSTSLTVSEHPKLRISYPIVCPNEQIEVEIIAPANSINKSLDNGINYIVDLISFDTLHISTIPNNNFFAGGNTGVSYFSFPDGGDHNVVVYLTDSTEKICRSVLDTFITTRTIPIVDFEANLVCADYQSTPTEFTNNTDANGTAIVGYRWDFGDGDTSSQENATHVFEFGGQQMVTLTAITDEGCESSLTKSIPVTAIPDADFRVEPEILEAYEDIFFFDETEIDTLQEIVGQTYYFGDGDSSNLLDPIHIYDEIKQYDIIYIVENNLGCIDTVYKTLDLNTYLELPNAFSPNGDGENDESFLLYKSIRELEEFKIYNRWGELVFDGGTDLDARWDGTFRGELQEVGVYVAYVKAIGAYDTQFNFKRNITLLR